jgi:hypothetical protein
MKRPTSTQLSNRFNGRFVYNTFQLIIKFSAFSNTSLFDQQVWLLIGVSIVVVIAILNLLQRYLEYRSAFEMNFKTGNKPRAEKWQTENQFLYVFGNLLSQGCFHNIVNYSSITASHSSHV